MQFCLIHVSTVLSNYCPISNLSLISKIIERIVKSRLTDHLSSNNLLNPHQSAYCKHHSTETALAYIHDHLINAVGSQSHKLSCLCLLDLSAAFDTIDHNILILVFHLGLGFMALFCFWFLVLIVLYCTLKGNWKLNLYCVFTFCYLSSNFLYYGCCLWYCSAWQNKHFES